MQAFQYASMSVPNLVSMLASDNRLVKKIFFYLGHIVNAVFASTLICKHISVQTLKYANMFVCKHVGIRLSL